MGTRRGQRPSRVVRQYLDQALVGGVDARHLAHAVQARLVVAQPDDLAKEVEPIGRVADLREEEHQVDLLAAVELDAALGDQQAQPVARHAVLTARVRQRDPLIDDDVAAVLLHVGDGFFLDMHPLNVIGPWLPARSMNHQFINNRICSMSQKVLHGIGKVARLNH